MVNELAALWIYCLTNPASSDLLKTVAGFLQMLNNNYSDELYSFYLQCRQKIESYTIGFEVKKTSKMNFTPLSVAKGNECFWDFFNKLIPIQTFQAMRNKI